MASRSLRNQTTCRIVKLILEYAISSKRNFKYNALFLFMFSHIFSFSRLHVNKCRRKSGFWARTNTSKRLNPSTKGSIIAQKNNENEQHCRNTLPDAWALKSINLSFLASGQILLLLINLTAVCPHRNGFSINPVRGMLLTVGDWTHRSSPIAGKLCYTTKINDQMFI